LPPLGASTEKKLSALLGVGTAVGNPLDTGWSGLSSRELYLNCIDLLLSDRDIDMLVLQEEVPLSNARPDKEGNLMAVAEVAERSDKPISMFSMITQSLNDYARDFKARCPLPFLQGTDNAVKMQGHLANFAEAVERHKLQKEAKPIALQPLSARARAWLASKKALNEWEAYSVLAEYGIPLAKNELATTPAEAVRAAKAISGRIALKVVAPGLTHKTELDGIRLNLSSAEEIQSAWRQMEETFKKQAPGQMLTGFLVQEMIHGGVETIIGTDNDPQFGPVVMFGIGGQAVELYKDVVFRLAPITPEEADRMIRSIKGFPLLAGFRSGPAVDLDTLAATVVAVSQLAVAGKDVIQSIDINPFMCLAQGGRAVDAVVVTRAPKI
ncbi:MAG TPA: acetate--CoA ligase family protein, partial [Candidatus Binatia bacterium]|nr:acetate--CoA ligase family protein [Candidatus Binatia bacterium]